MQLFIPSHSHMAEVRVSGGENPHPIKEIFMCLLRQLILILREVVCAQYLTEMAHGGKVLCE